MIPKRRKRPKMMAPKESAPISCEGHKKWVRGHECLCVGKMDRVIVGDDYALVPHQCMGRMEAHHVVSEGAGGGDEQVVPLCSKAHADGHRMGWETFQQRYRLELAATAADLWEQSPHGRRYRLQTTSSRASGSPNS